MTKFLVRCTKPVLDYLCCDVEVEADNEDDAIEMALNKASTADLYKFSHYGSTLEQTTAEILKPTGETQ